MGKRFIQFTSNVLTYRRMEIHEVDDLKADRLVGAGLAVELAAEAYEDITPLLTEES